MKTYFLLDFGNPRYQINQRYRRTNSTVPSFTPAKNSSPNNRSFNFQNYDDETSSRRNTYSSKFSSNQQGGKSESEEDMVGIENTYIKNLKKYETKYTPNESAYTWPAHLNKTLENYNDDNINSKHYLGELLKRNFHMLSK